MSLQAALIAASIPRDEWHEAHQGELVDIVGYVWRCDDDFCDCSQAVIVAQYRNLRVPRCVVPLTLWQGEFYTDGERGADADLAAKRAGLEAAEPDVAERIVWLR